MAGAFQRRLCHACRFLTILHVVTKAGVDSPKGLPNMICHARCDRCDSTQGSGAHWDDCLRCKWLAGLRSTAEAWGSLPHHCDRLCSSPLGYMQTGKFRVTTVRRLLEFMKAAS